MRSSSAGVITAIADRTEKGPGVGRPEALHKNGRNRTRTRDPFLVREVLSQLSYSPDAEWGLRRASVPHKGERVKDSATRRPGPPGGRARARYITSGVVMPIRRSVRASTALQAETSFSRAWVIASSPGSELTTRQSR